MSATKPHRRRHSIKTRLATSYALLAAITGICVLATVYVVLVVVPSYAFGELQGVDPIGDSVIVDNVNMGGFGENLDQGPVPGIILSSRHDIATLLLVAGTVVLLLLAAVGAWAGSRLADRMLNPLREVRLAAQHVASGSLEHRIGLAGPADEVRALADTFDDMMAELERSFAVTHRFAANASHELRTPLAATRALIDVSIRLSGGDHEVLSKLRTMNERSIETVTTLLDLAEIDAVAKVHEPLDLAVLAEEVMHEFETEAEELQVVVTTALEPAALNGDPALIRTLLSNLIQNGIRHNRPGGTLRILTHQGPAGSTFEVENDGAQIASEELAHFQEPFWTSGGRVGNGKSRGLGLSIASAVAARHNAGLVFTRRAAGGIRAQVVFRNDGTPAQILPR